MNQAFYPKQSLCTLGMNDINLFDRTVLIYGKGSKERRIQIGNDDVIHILEDLTFQDCVDAYYTGINKQ